MKKEGVKPSSLLRTLVNYGCRKFNNNGPRTEKESFKTWTPGVRDTETDAGTPELFQGCFAVFKKARVFLLGKRFHTYLV
jgi:hypothetical protein